MTASRLRDLIAHAIGEHRDVDAVSFARSTYTDRLGLTIRDVGGQTWRLHVMRDPWSRPDNGGDR